MNVQENTTYNRRSVGKKTPNICEPMNKQNVVYPQKRNEVLIHDTTWRISENIMPTKSNQTQKVTYYMTAFIQNVQNRQSHGDRMYISGLQGLGKWTMGSDC